GVSIDIPSGWKVEYKNEMMIGTSSDDAVGLVFWAVDKADYKEALKQADKIIDKVVDKAKWDKPAELELNGMKGIYMDGKGKVKGKKADLTVAIFGPTPTKKAIVVLGACDHDKMKAHEVELKDIFTSLKP